MQKISTHLWFDTEAVEAAQFYSSIFPNAKIKHQSLLHDTPSGDVDILTIQLADHEFTLISAGPLFKFTPAVSFLVACKTKEEAQDYWKKLSVGGSALMELGEYPFSEQYGWLQDKFGLSWQIMYMGERLITQIITPTMMFVGEHCGKAEEAVNFYASVFHNTKVNEPMRYAAGEDPDKVGSVKHMSFTLEGSEFAAMDSARMHDFTFNEAISFIVHCDTQEQIDYYWEKLSAVPESEQCGWLKDQYGFSWQIVPTIMDVMYEQGTEEQMARVTKAFLQMKKFDLVALQQAYEQD